MLTMTIYLEKQYKKISNVSIDRVTSLEKILLKENKNPHQKNLGRRYVRNFPHPI